jgi:hypothetical protein
MVREPAFAAAAWSVQDSTPVSRPRRKPPDEQRYHDAPLALASDGSVIANLVAMGEGSVLAALDRLRAAGHTVFVGVVLNGDEKRAVLAGIDDAAAEIVAWRRPRRSAAR